MSAFLSPAMKIPVSAFVALLTLASTLFARPPIRVLVHDDGSPAAHEVTQWLAGVLPRGAQWAKTLDEADVLVLAAGDLKADASLSRAELEAFARRGGGLVVIHGAVAAGAADWWKPLIGGAWSAQSRKFTSRMMLYVATDQHPIVKGASAFDLDDETLYDLDLQPEIQVLASAFTPKIAGRRAEEKKIQAQVDRANIYDLQPQLWAYEGPAGAGSGHRAVVALQGAAATWQHTSMRVFLLRAIAWAARHEQVDALCTEQQLAALRYPVGGPLTPDATVKQFELHPDFTASVVAAEPLINKPIAVQWDGDGRMWVAETPEYPNGRREYTAEPWKETGVLTTPGADRPAKDRISILTDPDANGRFTKKTVFFEGLELVTGFCLYRGGVIALAEPDIVWIHGEGAAQKIERLFTGFTPGDTHFVGNHLIVAPDGWIYANMGGSAEVKNPATGAALGRISSGLFRFRPDGSAIEQVSSKGGNGFGAEVTSDGELFFGQATSGNPIQHVALPESVLARGKVGTEGGAQSVIKGRKVVVPILPERIPLMQIDTVGGYSAACSSLVYEGGAWPRSWDGSIFCTEPILNIIHHEILRPSGATFTGEMVRPEAEFLRSPDYWFRPVDVSCGPDGALYILDFYNPVIAHSDSRGPLHSRSGASVRPDREHYFGRIYRVQHKEAKTLLAPKLEGADAATLAQNLVHPNKVVRFNALRLMMEKPGYGSGPLFQNLVTSGTPVEARMLALWGLQRINALSVEQLDAALADADARVVKTAALIAEDDGDRTLRTRALPEALEKSQGRTQAALLRAIAASVVTEAKAAAVLKLWPNLSDDLTKSAAVAAANANPQATIAASLSEEKLEPVADLVRRCAEHAVEQNDGETVLFMIMMAARRPEASALQIAVLEPAAKLKPAAAKGVPPERPNFRQVLARLLGSGDERLAQAALPLAATWEAAPLKTEIAAAVTRLLPQLADAKCPEQQRAQSLVSLIGASGADDRIWATVHELLTTANATDGLKRQAVTALAGTDDARAGTLLIESFDRLPASAQVAAFEAVLAKPEWTSAFLDAAEGGKVKLSTLGPANLFRLRSHPQKEIAQRAATVIGKLMKPNADKEKLIAQLAPLVSRPGNAAHGKELFTAACAVCHKLGDLGKEIGPVLTGIGAHGPEQLLVSIVDPNRVIDAGYEAYNVETTDGQFQTGLLASENEARVVLRGPAGDVEVPKAKIKSSENTHRSLMPEGFEALGAEALRDILTFICGDQARFRVLELTQAFTADTRRGLYQSQEHTHDTLNFVKFGLVTVEGVPFFIADPARSALGGNVIVLRGGPPPSFAHTLPERVEVPVNLPAKAFHFLGGVAGWGANRALPEGAVAMRLTAEFADGTKEKVELRNGDVFADYIGPIEVPGSKFAPGVVKDHQVRWFTVPVKHEGVVTKLVLESPGSGPATTTAAITAELR